MFETKRYGVIKIQRIGKSERRQPAQVALALDCLG